MKNMFDPGVADEVISRINSLTPDSKPAWGTMNVAQMLAHCNVTYEMDLEEIHPRPGAAMKLFLKLLVKKSVVSEKPYPRNSRTAPQFLKTDECEYDKEKSRLINYIRQVDKLGKSHYEGKESHGFGKLSSLEYSNMFYKHLDHHLTQFQV